MNKLQLQTNQLLNKEYNLKCIVRNIIQDVTIIDSYDTYTNYIDSKTKYTIGDRLDLDLYKYRHTKFENIIINHFIKKIDNKTTYANSLINSYDKQNGITFWNKRKKELDTIYSEKRTLRIYKVIKGGFFALSLGINSFLPKSQSRLMMLSSVKRLKQSKISHQLYSINLHNYTDLLKPKYPAKLKPIKLPTKFTKDFNLAPQYWLQLTINPLSLSTKRVLTSKEKRLLKKVLKYYKKLKLKQKRYSIYNWTKVGKFIHKTQILKQLKLIRLKYVAKHIKEKLSKKSKEQELLKNQPTTNNKLFNKIRPNRPKSEQFRNKFKPSKKSNKGEISKKFIKKRTRRLPSKNPKL